MRRSLILAGGGVKVAFQAGVLQVWLDEAGVRFDHADGASGGTFNLAMWCQGMSGQAIADAWRRTRPAAGASFDLAAWPRLLWGRALFTLDGYRRHVFPTWGLDWRAINASPREASFNLYNFSRHELCVLSAAQMDEDRLCACVSLPMWFPPVQLDGDTYIDSVFVTDANVEEAIHRGADEIWCVWTVSREGKWRDGFVAEYFQIIEAAANGRFKQICRRIEANNAAIAAGQRGEFGRHIELKVLEAEVPVHYLINLSQDRLVECVNLGVEKARRWCRERGLPLAARPATAPASDATPLRLRFQEELRGTLTLGTEAVANRAPSGRGDQANATIERSQASTVSVRLRLAITIEDVDRFVTDPAHEARAVGTIAGELFGGQREVAGSLHLFRDATDPHQKQITYRLQLEDGAGRPLTLFGQKQLAADPEANLWAEATTLRVEVRAGHGQAEGELVAAGTLAVDLAAFLEQLTTFQVEGPSLTARSSALLRFLRLFFGKLWDVYAVPILTYGPV